MSYLACPFIIALVVTLGQTGSVAVFADHNEAAEAEIKSLEFHLAKLLVAHKFDEYEKYLAADYTRINERGIVETRAQVMANFRAAREPSGSERMDPTELDVKVFGDVAILTGKLRFTNSAGAVRQSRFRKVFIHRGGRWFLVSLQGVTLSGGQ